MVSQDDGPPREPLPPRLADLLHLCREPNASGAKDAVQFTIQDVVIPFASPRLLWRMKQTHWEKDTDLLFLSELLKSEEHKKLS